jgi:hypothetical protein
MSVGSRVTACEGGLQLSRRGIGMDLRVLDGL